MYQHHVGMLDHGKVLGLLLQPRQDPLLAPFFRQDPLDRHIAFETQVERLVNLASPARSELSQQLVTSVKNLCHKTNCSLKTQSTSR